MKKILLICFVSLITNINYCFAEDCKFNYWEVIPESTVCDIFHLPDFDFRRLPPEENAPEHIKRFCNQFEISSKLGKQKSGYCYTGEGDPTGPHFRLGDETWNFSKSQKDKIYFADLNFTGCDHGKSAQGIVFGIYGWVKAPSFIERSWPLEKNLASCIGR